MKTCVILPDPKMGYYGPREVAYLIQEAKRMNLLSVDVDLFFWDDLLAEPRRAISLATAYDAYAIWSPEFLNTIDFDGVDDEQVRREKVCLRCLALLADRPVLATYFWLCETEYDVANWGGHYNSHDERSQFVVKEITTSDSGGKGLRLEIENSCPNSELPNCNGRLLNYLIRQDMHYKFRIPESSSAGVVTDIQSLAISRYQTAYALQMKFRRANLVILPFTYPMNDVTPDYIRDCIEMPIQLFRPKEHLTPGVDQTKKPVTTRNRKPGSHSQARSKTSSSEGTSDFIILDLKEAARRCGYKNTQKFRIAMIDTGKIHAKRLSRKRWKFSRSDIPNG